MLHILELNIYKWYLPLHLNIFYLKFVFKIKKLVIFLS